MEFAISRRPRAENGQGLRFLPVPSDAKEKARWKSKLGYTNKKSQYVIQLQELPLEMSLLTVGGDC